MLNRTTVITTATCIDQSAIKQYIRMESTGNWLLAFLHSGLQREQSYCETFAVTYINTYFAVNTHQSGRQSAVC